MKFHQFDGIYQERWGFSWAMLVSGRVRGWHEDFECIPIYPCKPAKKQEGSNHLLRMVMEPKIPCCGGDYKPQSSDKVMDPYREWNFNQDPNAPWDWNIYLHVS